MVSDLIALILGQDGLTHINLNACKSAGSKWAVNSQSNIGGLRSLDSNHFFKHKVPASGPLGEACI